MSLQEKYIALPVFTQTKNKRQLIREFVVINRYYAYKIKQSITLNTNSYSVETTLNGRRRKEGTYLVPHMLPIQNILKQADVRMENILGDSINPLNLEYDIIVLVTFNANKELIDNE